MWLCNPLFCTLIQCWFSQHCPKFQGWWCNSAAWVHVELFQFLYMSAVQGSCFKYTEERKENHFIVHFKFHWQAYMVLVTHSVTDSHQYWVCFAGSNINSFVQRTILERLCIWCYWHFQIEYYLWWWLVQRCWCRLIKHFSLGETLLG